MKKAIPLTLLMILMLFPADMAFSAWSDDPTVNTPVCTATGSQYSHHSISDGSGGAIFTWRDDRASDSDIYAQRFDSSGNPLWAANGVTVCTATNTQDLVQLIPDGSGGAIFTWRDVRIPGNQRIYAQRLDSNGNALWTANGVAVSTATASQSPQLVSDGSGGAFFTWLDFRNGDYDIFAQRLDSNGNPLWTANGVTVCSAANLQDLPQIVSDGSGGAIITWQDERNVNPNVDIFAQRIDSNGNPLWTADGVAVCTATNTQDRPKIASDGSGGAIITWEDWRNGSDRDIYAQRLNSNGNPLWTVDGVVVSATTNHQEFPEIISDGSGGAIITWYRDFRNATSAPDIYAQRVGPNGNSLWTANGAAVCTAADWQQAPQLVSDGSGGAIFSWYDSRSTIEYDIYAQRLDSSGNPLWTLDGVAVSTATNNQLDNHITSDGSGGAIISWQDSRSANNDIYAQQINSAGILGLSTARKTILIPWYNDMGGNSLLASFITVFNPSSQTITLTVTYTGPGSVNATPQANTLILEAGRSKAGRPFQVSGIGEGTEQGPPVSMPNATSSAPFGSATFSAQMPAGFTIHGDTLRMGGIDLNQDGTPESFSGIAPAYSR